MQSINFGSARMKNSDSDAVKKMSCQEPQQLNLKKMVDFTSQDTLQLSSNTQNKPGKMSNLLSFAGAISMEDTLKGFHEFVGKISDLTSVSSLLDWDRQTGGISENDDANDASGKQTATIGGIINEMETSPKMAEYLEQLRAKKDELSPLDKALLRDFGKIYEDNIYVIICCVLALHRRYHFLFQSALYSATNSLLYLI